MTMKNEIRQRGRIAWITRSSGGDLRSFSFIGLKILFLKIAGIFSSLGLSDNLKGWSLACWIITPPPTPKNFNMNRVVSFLVDYKQRIEQRSWCWSFPFAPRAFPWICVGEEKRMAGPGRWKRGFFLHILGK